LIGEPHQRRAANVLVSVEARNARERGLVDENVHGCFPDFCGRGQSRQLGHDGRIGHVLNGPRSSRVIRMLLRDLGQSSSRHVSDANLGIQAQHSDQQVAVVRPLERSGTLRGSVFRKEGPKHRHELRGVSNSGTVRRVACETASQATVAPAALACSGEERRRLSGVSHDGAA